MDVGYARVSTTHQDLDRQLDALRKQDIPDERIYADKKTGATVERDGLNALLAYARPGDTVVCYTLDRLGRNIREVLNLVHELREKGVGVRTLADAVPINTADTSPMAEVVVALFAFLAHLERIWNKERVAHARAVAEVKGKRAGRPRCLNTTQIAGAKAAIAAEQPAKDVAADLKVSLATLYRYLAEHKEEKEDNGDLENG